jgi:hypothetical protein
MSRKDEDLPIFVSHSLPGSAREDGKITLVRKQVARDDVLWVCGNDLLCPENFVYTTPVSCMHIMRQGVVSKGMGKNVKKSVKTRR